MRRTPGLVTLLLAITTLAAAPASQPANETDFAKAQRIHRAVMDRKVFKKGMGFDDVRQAIGEPDKKSRTLEVTRWFYIAGEYRLEVQIHEVTGGVVSFEESGTIP